MLDLALPSGVTLDTLLHLCNYTCQDPSRKQKSLGFNEESLMMGLFNNLRRKKQVEEIVWGLMELRIKGPPIGWWSWRDATASQRQHQGQEQREEISQPLSSSPVTYWSYPLAEPSWKMG